MLLGGIGTGWLVESLFLGVVDVSPQKAVSMPALDRRSANAEGVSGLAQGQKPGAAKAREAIHQPVLAPDVANQLPGEGRAPMLRADTTATEDGRVLAVRVLIGQAADLLNAVRRGP